MRLILGLILKGPPIWKGTSIFLHENKILLLNQWQKGISVQQHFIPFKKHIQDLVVEIWLGIKVIVFLRKIIIHWKYGVFLCSWTFWNVSTLKLTHQPFCIGLVFVFAETSFFGMQIPFHKADVLNSGLVLVARTDAEAATMIDSNIDAWWSWDPGWFFRSCTRGYRVRALHMGNGWVTFFVFDLGNLKWQNFRVEGDKGLECLAARKGCEYHLIDKLHFIVSFLWRSGFLC